MNENIITPRIETPPEEHQESIPQDLLDAGINLKNIEFLSYLGLKTGMFDPDIMGKIQEIADYLPDSDALQAMDINLGNPHGVSRLDKIYMHIQLLKQEDLIKEKQELLNKEKSKYYV
jgi:hypothetical protein